MTIGTQEMLIIAGILGGITAMILRKRTNTRNRAVYFILGFAGGILSSLLLSWALYASYITLPIYGIFGGWFAAFAFGKWKR